MNVRACGCAFDCAPLPVTATSMLNTRIGTPLSQSHTSSTPPHPLKHAVHTATPTHRVHTATHRVPHRSPKPQSPPQQPQPTESHSLSPPSTLQSHTALFTCAAAVRCACVSAHAFTRRPPPPPPLLGLTRRRLDILLRPLPAELLLLHKLCASLVHPAAPI